MALARLCSAEEMPVAGQMREMACGGRALCVANENGVYAAVDNVCPHRGGPLAEGSLENGKVLCPWHAWAFDLRTGRSEDGGSAGVAVYPLQLLEGQVYIEL